MSRQPSCVFARQIEFHDLYPHLHTDRPDPNWGPRRPDADLSYFAPTPWQTRVPKWACHQASPWRHVRTRVGDISLITTQFRDLTLQRLQPFALVGAHATASALVNLVALGWGCLVGC